MNGPGAKRSAWARPFALAACLLAAPAQALDLESDLSTHYIEIRTTFRGASLTVFGSLSGQTIEEEQPGALDVIVVVKGPAETLAIRRKEEVGPIWVNGTNVIAAEVPSFCFVASTRPVDKIVDPALLDRYHIGLDHLGIDFKSGTQPSAPAHQELSATNDEVLPFDLPTRASPVSSAPLSVAAALGVDQLKPFKAALIRLLQARNLFSSAGTVTFVRPHLFRAEISIPSTVPEGDYGTEIYVVRNRQLLSAEYTVFFIDKKGLEGKIFGMAEKNPFGYGLLGVLIAVAAGSLSELAFRRR